MLIAFIGILGVLLGGFLNALFSYLLARRSDGRQTKTAARLVLPELLENRDRLAAALETKRWGSVDFKTRRWQQHELVIASGFGKEWELLAMVYTAMVLLNNDRPYYDEEEEIDEIDDVQYMQLAAENLDDAIEVLRKRASLTHGRVLQPPTS